MALDVMRPADAFAADPPSRLDDPARWLRPMLLVLATTVALAVLLGAGRPLACSLVGDLASRSSCQ